MKTLILTMVLSIQLFASDIEKYANQLTKSHPMLSTGKEFEFDETKKRVKEELDYIFKNYLTAEGHKRFKYYTPGSVSSIGIMSNISRTVGGETSTVTNGVGDYFLFDANAVYALRLGTCFDAGDYGSYRYYYFALNLDNDFKNPKRKDIVFLSSNGSKVSKACEEKYFKNL